MNYKEKVFVYNSLTKEQWEVVNEVFQLYSCCPMTGRYGKVNDVFKEAGSEYALNRNRVWMEIMYLITFCEKLQIYISPEEIEKLNCIASDFDMLDCLKIKEIEKTTNHDVKAVEYFIREKLAELGMEYLIPYVHIGLTSEDTNNISYSKMFKECLEIWKEKAQELINTLVKISLATKSFSKLGFTHGQPATPLTYGHSVICNTRRLVISYNKLLNGMKLEIKLKGAVGNMAALCQAYPDIDWSNFDEEFMRKNHLFEDFDLNRYPTQIEQHDSLIRILDEVKNFTNIVTHIARDDIWQDIHSRYLIQIPKEGEVGSSTMPQKVNPINAENSWGNGYVMAGMENAITQKLSESIMQRDLSDSTTIRNVPMLFLYSYQSMSELIKMLGKIEVNGELMLEDLRNNPEVIAEAIQTVLRKNCYRDAYEQMKKLTRGKKLTLEEIHEFVRGLDINEADKENLLVLDPAGYFGLSEKLVEFFVFDDNDYQEYLSL